MALDVTGIILIILFFIRGYMKGLIVAAFSVLAILLGAMCALKLSHSFAAWMLEKGYVSSAWAQVLSYVVLFVVVVLLVRLVAKLIEKALEGMMLGIVNKLAGGLLYAFLGAVLWSSVLWIGSYMHLISAELIAASKTYTTLSRLAPWFCEQLGKLIPYFKGTFSGLEHFFDSVNQEKPQHVGTDR